MLHMLSLVTLQHSGIQRLPEIVKSTSPRPCGSRSDPEQPSHNSPSASLLHNVPRRRAVGPLIVGLAASTLRQAKSFESGVAEDECEKYAKRKGTWGDYICAGPCCQIPWGPGGPIGVVVGLTALRTSAASLEAETDRTKNKAIGTLGFGLTCLLLSAPRSSGGIGFSGLAAALAYLSGRTTTI
eukprot:CAMPEP_0167802610 /NCGR_PEP_ID=MMETSP0111_2-20121227/19243_1 /TAXON_ID=91324 /ORGANISM="Lotharella globosa, Strain CCCM811" /LENGTH=183 /DNA_ID=CAMNT_0007698721 /DNA_START=1 /DNA_END=552 /DNA_ORIENTATION=+